MQMIADDLVVVICFRTRAIQKLIETVKTRKQIALIVSALEPGFMHLVNDLNGNHVIQKCLSNFGAEENKVHSSSYSKSALFFCCKTDFDQHLLVAAFSYGALNKFDNQYRNMEFTSYVCGPYHAICST
jgi:hypothetical protein